MVDTLYHWTAVDDEIIAYGDMKGSREVQNAYGALCLGRFLYYLLICLPREQWTLMPINPPIL
jgi:hypothetical protein